MPSPTGLRESEDAAAAFATWAARSTHSRTRSASPDSMARFSSASSAPLRRFVASASARFHTDSSTPALAAMALALDAISFASVSSPERGCTSRLRMTPALRSAGTSVPLPPNISARTAVPSPAADARLRGARNGKTTRTSSVPVVRTARFSSRATQAEGLSSCENQHALTNSSFRRQRASAIAATVSRERPCMQRQPSHPMAAVAANRKKGTIAVSTDRGTLERSRSRYRAAIASKAQEARAPSRRQSFARKRRAPRLSHSNSRSRSDVEA